LYYIQIYKWITNNILDTNPRTMLILQCESLYNVDFTYERESVCKISYVI